MTRHIGLLTYRSLLSMLVLLVATSVAGAQQKKISGVSHCGKPEKQESIPVGDQPGHVFGISKVKCTWTKPFEIEGIQSKEDEITGFSEVMGDKVNERMYVVMTMSNGDKAFARPSGTSSLKDGAPQSASGEWSYAGGTGKLTGIKGKGTYKCAWGSDGTAMCDIAGHYTLPKGKGKK
jgi:hypothetical protein